MAETDLERIEPIEPGPTLGDDITESAGSGGFLHIEEKQEDTTSTSDNMQVTVPRPSVQATTPISPRAMERMGTAEHLAVRRPVPVLDVNEPDVKNCLSELRAEVTRLVTGLRWGGQSVDATTERIIPLLNLGPIQQWRPVLIPFLFEVDRAGNMIPVWLKIIERAELQDLPATANPAETSIGRARRYAILMLGNYKTQDGADQNKAVGFARASTSVGIIKTPEFIKVLGKLATDPNTSLYATQSLAKQSTTPSIQVLVTALKDAEGWAKVDVVEGILALKQTQFHEIVLANGLDRVPGLESYVAVPLYRAIPLENYLRGDTNVAPRLSQQAALVVGQVLQDSMTLPKPGTNELPIIFENDLPSLASVLFEGARRTPTWQAALALHRLGLFLGRYWSETARGAIEDARIIDLVYATSPMMNEVERWMNGPGREVLLSSLTDANDETFPLIVKTLGELRDPRATSVLLQRLDSTNELVNREQALSLAAVCDTLARLGDRRSVASMLQLLHRVVDTNRRAQLSKRRDNLAPGDKEIPGSIVYAAVLRASGQFGERGALEDVLRAVNDFDPYVRTQAIEALKHIDPKGEDIHSRTWGREALNDARDTVVHAACQLVVQYHDMDAVPVLRGLINARNDLSPAAYDALRRLGM
ncbi:MAG: hypothetical protein NVS4B11_36050 [Ktedonobacteraceae bacterium]